MKSVLFLLKYKSGVFAIIFCDYLAMPVGSGRQKGEDLIIETTFCNIKFVLHMELVECEYQQSRQPYLYVLLWVVGVAKCFTFCILIDVSILHGVEGVRGSVQC